MNGFEKIIQALLGKDKTSSLAGLIYAVAVIVWQLKEEGYADWRMIAIALGIGLLLRFLNESFPGLGDVGVKVAQQLARMPQAIPPRQPESFIIPLRDTGLQKQLEEAQRRALAAENEAAVLRAQLAMTTGELKQGEPKL